MDDQPARGMYIELGRNFAAAYIAYQMGLRSINYARKNYVGDDVGEFSIKLAESVDLMSHEIRTKRFGGEPD